ncbi:hypothetical protein [Parabacteroides sp. PF5-9]|uniref:hypothetical protein n=1 Tax=Parabacteroides sp. PF5-9 TaxID=1742404 RepID=UPI002473EB5E|nr:hypothetical protein [Parabacteroides sp. PF5-9]MDH6357631.1 hypothetical protein [Parabacteroides sp. PF5-9]
MAKGKKGFQPGNTVGKQFSATRQPEKSGRKPTLYKQLFKATAKRVEIELSKEDYYNILRYLMERTPSELRTIAKCEQTPIWVSNIISSIFTDTKAGKVSTLNILFDRLFGKPTQIIESEIGATISSKQEIDLSVLTTEELLIYNSFLDKISNQDKK